jgi:hypothetical protein
MATTNERPNGASSRRSTRKFIACVANAGPHVVVIEDKPMNEFEFDWARQLLSIAVAFIGTTLALAIALLPIA